MEVEDEQIDAAAVDVPDRLGPVSGRDHLRRAGRRVQALQRAPRELAVDRVVVEDQDANRHQRTRSVGLSSTSRTRRHGRRLPGMLPGPAILWSPRSLSARRTAHLRGGGGQKADLWYLPAIGLEHPVLPRRAALQDGALLGGGEDVEVLPLDGAHDAAGGLLGADGAARQSG